MGLDFLDVVVSLERRFGVTISDQEVAGLRTVEDIVGLLEGRVQRREAVTCLSLPWFLKLRRLTRDVAGDNQLVVRPSSPVAEVLTPEQRKQLWKRLPDLLGKKPQDLERPHSIGLLIFLGFLVEAVLGLAVLSMLDRPLLFGLVGGAYTSWWVFLLTRPQNLTSWLLVGLLEGGLGVWLVILMTRPLKTHPPEGYKTFGEITQRLVAREAATVGFPSGSAELIRIELAEVLSQVVGVDPDEVTMDARLIEDLDMG